ncbi:down syndrome cell adhesion molecule-like protein Dscam2 [Nephila pilipes]|uniref:Down syndrome cell adhesion molecule-like protein Dscam2 n=1 Tax=Nephila pilipes TaxID=299642 RepID=A0A8X6TDH1_NEPPI|nr:down syndrome cell adhesion molecule-like protein Dscam2 [Nephila pilipes]
MCWAFSLASSQDRKGPVFTIEPPNRVEFSNATGTVIPCSAEGIPPPTIRWAHALDGSYISDVPGLRHVRPDGSLVFPPFRAEDQRPDVHTTDYRCLASNSVGAIGSRDVRVKGGECYSVVRNMLSKSCLIRHFTEIDRNY